MSNRAGNILVELAIGISLASLLFTVTSPSIANCIAQLKRLHTASMHAASAQAALMLLVRELHSIRPSSIHKCSDVIIWNNGTKDIGWHTEGGYLMRREGQYSALNHFWKNGRKQVVATHIDNLQARRILDAHKEPTGIEIAVHMIGGSAIKRRVSFPIGSSL